MASIDEVLDTIAEQVAAVYYPVGHTQGETSVTGDVLLVYPGWPGAEQLEQALGAGRAHLSIWPRDQEKNVTRYFDDWPEEIVPAATLQVQFEKNSQLLQLSGNLDIAHNVGVTASAWHVSVPLTAGLSLEDAAIAIATGITGAGGAAVAIGQTVSLQEFVTPAVGVTGTMLYAPRQQQRSVQLTLWTSSPAQRRRLAATLEQYLVKTQRLSLPDATTARFEYQNSHFEDRFQKTALFRRDFFVDVEFSTIVSETVSQITVAPVSTVLCP